MAYPGCTVVLVAGGSYSGKTAIISAIQRRLDTVSNHGIHSVIARLDLFSRRDGSINDEDDEDPHELANENCQHRSSRKRDSPGVYDFAALYKEIQYLKAGSHKGANKSESIKLLSENTSSSEIPPDVVFIEGGYALYDPTIRRIADLRLFIECDPDKRLAKMVVDACKPPETSQAEIGKRLEAVINDYLGTRRPAMQEFIAPSKQYADIIVNEAKQDAAIELLALGIYDNLISNNHHHHHHNDLQNTIASAINEPLSVDSPGAYLPSLRLSNSYLMQEDYLTSSDRFYDVS